MNDTTAISELTGKPVSTWSEEWRHECELRYVLGLSPADREIKVAGASSLRANAAGLNARGIRTSQDKPWSAMQVMRVLERA